MTKRISSMSILLLLIVTPAVLAGGGKKVAATAKAPAGVVATIHGSAVTEADLDDAVGSRLMRVRTEEYNIRRAALDQLVAERLFEAEAAKRGISKEELVRLEVEDKVPVVSSETIAEVYEGVKERFANADPQEAMRQIAAGMRRQKVEARRAELTRTLAAAAGVKIYLEPPRSVVHAGGPAKGSASAPITIVEFSDFECTFCNGVIPTLRKLQERYGDQVRIVYRDYILPSHRNAAKAAEAAHCAGDQGKYWEMHDRLFERQRSLSPIEFIKWAGELSLDTAAFEQCLASSRHKNTWQTSHADGDRAGVRSTPTFFINGRMVIGAANLEMFTRVIDEELVRLGSPPVTTMTSASTGK